MALTEKQKAFAQQLAAGKTQAEAYKLAFNVDNSPIESVRTMASREANKPEIRQAVERYKELIANEFAVEQTKSELFIRSLLYDRMIQCHATGDDTALARYADILNKMDGRYKTITQDLTENKNPVTELSTEALERLLESGNMGIAPTDSVASTAC